MISYQFLKKLLYNILFYLSIILTLATLIPLLITIAFFTLAERKIMAVVQRRTGPNVVGIYGILQPFADGFKLLLKEIIIPSNTNKFIFLLAPILTFSLSLIGWALIPFEIANLNSPFINYNLFYLYAISSFGVYGIILSGWSSNSRYPFLGALRSAAQMISYEVSISLIFLIIILFSQSLDLTQIVYSQSLRFNIVPLFPSALIFFISSLAETNRAPFDLPEAEAEIVAGYNLEYSSITFALFFLGEYSNILIMCALTSLLFLGGWISLFSSTSSIFWFVIKILFVVYFFIAIRAAYPRYRYDQLMSIGWTIFLPFNLVYLLALLIFFSYYGL